MAARRHQIDLAAAQCAGQTGGARAGRIITKGGKVVTRPADNGILRGITRTVLIEVIEAHGLQFEERPFTVEEAQGAREAFLTSASQIVMPVVRIDDRPVGNGAPGSVALDGAHSAPNLCLRRPRTCPVMARSGSFRGCSLENGHSDLAIKLAGRGP